MIVASSSANLVRCFEEAEEAGEATVSRAVAKGKAEEEEEGREEEEEEVEVVVEVVVFFLEGLFFFFFRALAGASSW